MLKPENRRDYNFPRSLFLGSYDGYGGSISADFLRDYLYQFVIYYSSFPRIANAERRRCKQGKNSTLRECLEDDEFQGRR